MSRKELTVAMVETYLADFITAKQQIVDRITSDPDIQATVAFMNGIRPLTLLKRLKEIPTTTLKKTIARFQLITTSEAEIALINIKEGVAARRPQIDRQQQQQQQRLINPISARVSSILVWWYFFLYLLKIYIYDMLVIRDHMFVISNNEMKKSNKPVPKVPNFFFFKLSSQPPSHCSSYGLENIQ